MSEFIREQGGQEIIGVNRVEGPIVIVEGAGDVGYDETVEIIDSLGTVRRGRVLEVGVGHATLGVIAIDNGPDVMAYVGPLYTYYEFTHPVGDRLTDQQFSWMLLSSGAPPRPAWVSSFQPPPAPRAPHVP